MLEAYCRGAPTHMKSLQHQVCLSLMRMELRLELLQWEMMQPCQKLGENGTVINDEVTVDPVSLLSDQYMHVNCPLWKVTVCCCIDSGVTDENYFVSQAQALSKMKAVTELLQLIDRVLCDALFVYLLMV